MKTIAATLIALGLLTGTAAAKSPRDIFTDLNQSAPMSPFDAIADTAPASPYGGLGDHAPRSDGVFGDLKRNAP